MARLIQASRRTLFSSHSFFSSKTLISSQLKHIQSSQIHNPNYSSCLFQFRNYMSEMRKSTLDGHLLRVLRNEIQYEIEYAPPQEPVKEYKSLAKIYTVEDCPGEQWIKLQSNDDNESIKIEVTMFDGATQNSKKNGEEEMQFHISLMVEVTRKDDSSAIQIVCSAWPDRLEVQNVYCIGSNGLPDIPYMGPDFKDVSRDLHDSVYNFLEDRGIDDDFAAFLHQYVTNKDRAELIRWMNKVKSFVEA
ncbi:hypothetical protein AQUCO_01600161v1 [Aquilegia coerulea]|uniref:Mitochondrial glycoprotein n=1 Tax=Aquilegia coerulea TaxID=218851 RepID=A0A2G5DQL8_AQUCA|nr:hypothetical protein AQUCO_01600161v1 [Aquilegia coerulea]